MVQKLPKQFSLALSGFLGCVHPISESKYMNDKLMSNWFVLYECTVSYDNSKYILHRLMNK